jgi:uncharacterized protein YbaR (Trm112 family)
MASEPLAKELFEILSCPICKGKLRYSPEHDQLVCTQCGLKYPIEDGIPILLPPKTKLQ